MARHVNAAFGGVNVLDVDPNALTRTRWLDETAGDTALVADLITGNNSPPVVLDHSGPGNGCLLGYPQANHMPRDYNIQGDGDTADVDPCQLWGVLDAQPDGEGGCTLLVDLDGYTEGPQPLRFEVRSSSWAVADNVVLGQSGDVWSARAQGLTPGNFYTYRLLCDDISTLARFRIRSVRLGNFRQVLNRPLMSRAPTDVDNSTELSSQTVSSATVVDVQDLDTAEVQTEALAISGYHATQIAQTQHALEEMLTGAPAGTNVDRVLTPHSTQSTWYDHGRLGSEFASMPLIGRIPLAAWGLGACPEDGGTGEDGLGGWLLCKNAPGWATAASASYRQLFDWSGHMPQHRANRLQCLILAYSPDGSIVGGATVPTARVRTYDNAGTLVDTVTQTTWTQLGSSKWYSCGLTGIDHAPGVNTRVLLDIKCTTVAKVDGSSLRIAGVSLGMVDA